VTPGEQTPPPGEIIHAGCVARRQNGSWSAVLLTGRAGVGKSDLMLRLVERGWSLVADDRVRLWTAKARSTAARPRPWPA
jgi:HPr kinase/phosphorylase